MKKRLFLDVDGIVADFVGSVVPVDRETFQTQYEIELGLRRSDEHLRLYRVAGFANHQKMMTACDRTRFWTVELQKSQDSFEIMDLVLEKLQENEDIEICFLTSPPRTGVVDFRKCRLFWLSCFRLDYMTDRNLGTVPKFRVITTTDKAGDIDPGPFDFLVDDYEENVKAWQEKGAPALLMPTLVNTLRGDVKSRLSLFSNFLQQI